MNTSSATTPHAWLGVILTERDWDWTGAERAFRRALELDPNFAYAHKLYAEYLSYVGRFNEAIAEARLARRLDPLSIVTNSLVGLVVYRARQYEQALEALQHAIELDPDHQMPYLPQGLALSMQGRHDPGARNRAARLPFRVRTRPHGSW